jgi:hypothetical protein
MKQQSNLTPRADIKHANTVDQFNLAQDLTSTSMFSEACCRIGSPLGKYITDDTLAIMGSPYHKLSALHHGPAAILYITYCSIVGPYRQQIRDAHSWLYWQEHLTETYTRAIPECLRHMSMFRHWIEQA